MQRPGPAVRPAPQAGRPPASRAAPASAPTRRTRRPAESQAIVRSSTTMARRCRRSPQAARTRLAPDPALRTQHDPRPSEPGVMSVRELLHGVVRQPGLELLDSTGSKYRALRSPQGRSLGSRPAGGQARRAPTDPLQHPSCGRSRRYYDRAEIAADNAAEGSEDSDQARVRTLFCRSAAAVTADRLRIRLPTVASAAQRQPWRGTAAHLRFRRRFSR